MRKDSLPNILETRKEKVRLKLKHVQKLIFE